LLDSDNATTGDDAVHVGHDSAELGETPPVPDEDEKSSIWSCLSQCGGNDACLRRPGPDFLEPKIKIPGRWKIRITIG